MSGVNPASFARWRQVHRACSGAVALLSIAHLAIALARAQEWTPDSLWFAATGLGLLYLAVMNWAHVGLEPCTQPTAVVVRWGNWSWAVLGVAAVAAVPETHALVLAIALIGQAIAGHRTLHGPD